MALGPNTLYEVRADATPGNLNGGGFNYSNANFLTDFTTDANTANTAAPIISSASYNFVAADDDAWAYIVAGTNTFSIMACPITSVAGNKATLDASLGVAIKLDPVTLLWRPTSAALGDSVGIASVGTPTNVTIGINFSQQTAAEVSSTDLASVATSLTVTSAAGGFRRIMTGNILHITAGTNDVPGWYEVVNFTDANTITIDRDCTTGGNMSAGVGTIGGAMSMSSTLDDDFLEVPVPGNWVFFRGDSGAISLGENIGITVGIGTAVSNIRYEGYDTVRGDSPMGSDRPTWAAGIRQTTMGSFTKYNNIIFTTTHASGWVKGLSQKCWNNKYLNTTTTDDSVATQSGAYDGCEMICYRGRAITWGSTSQTIKNNYIHDSDISLLATTTGTPRVLIEGNIFANNVESCLQFTGAALNGVQILKNTFYGNATNKTGIAVQLPAAVAAVEIKNNIITGFVTGVDNTDASTDGWDDYNCYYNNTNDVSAVTEWQKGPHDVALDPQFVNVTPITGTGASSSTNVLTDATKDFTALGVTTNDHVYLSAGTGTGINLRIFGITAVGTTTLTLTSVITSSGAGSDIAYQMTIGNNYAIGTNLKALGFPGQFDAGNTTAYTDIGAVQRQEQGSGGSGGFFIS